MTNEWDIHAKKGGTPMPNTLEKVHVKKTLGWEPAGYKIKLIIDGDGYLTDEPRFIADNSVVGFDPLGPHCPKPPSLIGYRVRLMSSIEDPREAPPDPKGCRLFGGVWYC
jgi:hypothetical protein